MFRDVDTACGQSILYFGKSLKIAQDFQRKIDSGILFQQIIKKIRVNARAD